MYDQSLNKERMLILGNKWRTERDKKELSFQNVIFFTVVRDGYF